MSSSPHYRRSPSPNTRLIQNSLRELGIDIDGELINRLQNNLNISKTFDTVNRTVQLLNSDKIKRKINPALNREITLKVKSNNNKYASQPPVEDTSFDFISSKVSKSLEATAMEILETLGDYTDHTVAANTKSMSLKAIELLHIKFMPDPIKFLKLFFGIHRDSSKKEVQVVFTANRLITLKFLQSSAFKIIPHLNTAYIPELYKVLQMKQGPVEGGSSNLADFWLLCAVMRKYSTRLFNHKLYVASHFWLNKDSNTNKVQYSDESDNPMKATRSSKGILTRRVANVAAAGEDDIVSSDPPPYVRFWNEEDISAKMSSKHSSLEPGLAGLIDRNSSTAECFHMKKHEEPKPRCTAGFFDRQQKIDNTLPPGLSVPKEMVLVAPKEASLAETTTTIYMENPNLGKPGNQPRPVFTFVSELREMPKGPRRCTSFAHSIDNSNKGTTKNCLDWEHKNQPQPISTRTISTGTVRRCEASNNCKMNLILTGEEKHLQDKTSNRRYCPPHTENLHYRDTLQ